MEEYQGLREEINFMSLIFYILEKWRWIIVSMLIFAILSGGYKYLSAINVNQMAIKKETATEKSAELENPYEKLIEKKVSDLEQRAEYLNNSTVMQMDSHLTSVGTLNYYIECDEHKGSLLSAYTAYVTGGELVAQLYEIDSDISVEDLQYLVSLIKTDYNNEKNAEGYIVIDDSNDIGPGTAVFQIQIKMPESDLCEKYIEYAQELITEYSSQLQDKVAKHKLTLLSSVQVEETDLEIQEYQSGRWTEYLNAVTNLETLRAKNSNADISDVMTVQVVNPVNSFIKYAFLGLALGIFFACFILMLMYLLGGRLENTENFKTGFGMPLLGIVRISGTKKKVFGFIDNWVFALRDKAYAKISVEEQIKMAAINVQSMISKTTENGNITKIMLAGTVPEKDVDMLYTQLIAEMRETFCSPYMQIVYQASALKELDNYDGILFLEKRGMSQSSLIVQEKRLALDRGVKVLGTIVVC